MKLSDYIKQYRKENNLSQTAFAKQLFVSKQAVSKWENDKALPDVTMYPVLSELLQVSVDELMGIEKKKIQKNRKNILYILGIIILTIIVVTIVLIVVNNNSVKHKQIKETEKYLQIKLPRIEQYSFINFNNFIQYNNLIYPQNMYQFIFKDEIITVDETWLESKENDIIENVPYIIKFYIADSDYYKLINKDTKIENEIPNPNDNIFTRYALYCIDIENNRLVVINFEV